MTKAAELLKVYADSLTGSGARPYARLAEEFLDWLGSRQPDSEAAQKYIVHLRKETYADGTLLKVWNVLARFYKVNNLPWKFKRGESPVIREQDVYAPALAAEDISAMVDCVLERTPALKVIPTAAHRAFLCLSTVWGMRRVEMSTVTPDYLQVYSRLTKGIAGTLNTPQLMAGTLFVETAKKGRQRYHVIPDFIMPHLTAWGFSQPVSVGLLSQLFTDLKAMIGLTGPSSMDLGWHGIRRSSVQAAFDAGFTDPQINSYYRWKRSSNNMALRYATTRIVGRSEERKEVGSGDRDIDLAFYARHPFVQFWKESVSDD